jgi:hypothetical protein
MPKKVVKGGADGLSKVGGEHLATCQGGEGGGGKQQQEDQ